MSSVWNEESDNEEDLMLNFRRLVAASLEGLVTMGMIECRLE